MKQKNYYIICDKITVNIGEELLIVSTNEIVVTFKAIKPNTIENNLNYKGFTIKNI